MLKRIFIALSALLILSVPAHALELVRQKNVATYIVVPLVDADGDVCTGAAGLDTELDFFEDGSAPDGFADATNEATEIGSTGQYYLSLAQAELNHGYIIGQVKTSTSGCKTQTFLIRTLVGDPLNIATTDDGGTINVTGGAVDTTTAVTNSVVLPTGTGAGQINLSGGAVALQADQAVNMTKIAGAAVATGTAQLGVNVVNWKGSAAAAMTGDAFARLGAPAGASVSADIAAVKGDTAAILTDTAAMDTANELRTLLTGGTSALSILTASDNIGINWADITNPTTAVNLSGTNIKTDQVVGSVSGAVGSVTGNVGGNIVGTVPDSAGTTTLVGLLTAARAGYLDKLNVSGTLAHSDAANTYKADVSGLATALALAAVDTKIDTIDGIVDAILVDTGTTIEGHLTDIKGATFSGLTDSLEAIRNRGDVAWLTATGFSTHSASDVVTAMQAVADDFKATGFSTHSPADVVTAMETNGSKLDHLWEMTEDDAGVRRLTENALEEAPAGGSAPTVQEIRAEIDTNSTQLAAILQDTGTTLDDLVDDLESRLSATRAGYLDNLTNLDAAISSRLATLGYTAPDNAGISTIQGKTDNLPDDPADASVLAGLLATIQTDLDNPDQYKANVSNLDVAVSTRLAATSYTAPDNASIAAILEDTGTTIPGLIGALNNISAGDVKTAIEANGSKLDHLWEMTEDDAGTRRLTENALEQAPAGGTSLTAEDVWTHPDRIITGLSAAALADMFDTNSGTTYEAAVDGSPVKEIVDNAGGGTVVY